jgi:hypothetical protein
MLEQIVILALVALGAYLIYKLVKNIVVIALNSIIGFFALFGYQAIFGANIAINFWSVIITAVGGIFGFIAVLAAHYLGLAF